MRERGLDPALRLVCAFEIPGHHRSDHRPATAPLRPGLDPLPDRPIPPGQPLGIRHVIRGQRLRPPRHRQHQPQGPRPPSPTHPPGNHPRTLSSPCPAGGAGRWRIDRPAAPLFRKWFRTKTSICSYPIHRRNTSPPSTAAIPSNRTHPQATSGMPISRK